MTKITITTRLEKIVNEGYPANVFLLRCCWTALERSPIKDSTGVLFIIDGKCVCLCVCVLLVSGVYIGAMLYLLDCTRMGTSLGLVYTADARMYWCNVGLHSIGHLSKISVYYWCQDLLMQCGTALERAPLKVYIILLVQWC